MSVELSGPAFMVRSFGPTEQLVQKLHAGSSMSDPTGPVVKH
jgi:hypothetical protein